ncbi:hypothetical protein [Chryseobacterium sp. G0162]|uniref:hypothetical protein n=1 Tax=Chryseobacterium sp. G0162 TaxID=2487063 RepID=UPI0013DE76FD|nr:hypothetical protein [Chryseobacterium sp. G0162]
MLLTSCAQDETRDNVISSEKTVSVNENKTSRIGLTTVEFIKEVYNPSVLNAEEATLRAWRQKIPTYYAA